MRQSRPWLPYVLLAVALFLLAFHEAGLLAPVENALTFVIAPVERGFSSAVDFLRGLFTDVRDVRELQQEVEELRRVNETLRVENIRLREQYVAENEQLRERNDSLESRVAAVEAELGLGATARPAPAGD